MRVALSTGFVLAVLLLGLPHLARAQAVATDRVTLAEVLPALAGSDLGAVDLGAAPIPGGTLVLRASEMRRAIRAAGRDARGLDIPRLARIRRDARQLDREAIERLLRPAVLASLAPCEVSELSLPSALLLPAGVPEVVSTATAPRASGRVTAPLLVTVGGQETRVLASARVVCPAPIIAAGARVRIVVIVGAVRASVPGIVAQPGRLGDEVRVTNTETRVQLRGRVIDASTVEVRP